MGNYIDTHKDKIQKTPGGTLCQVFGDKEGASCSVALVTMDEHSDGLKHYHDNITEIYLFSKGKGSIIINGNENKIENGDCYIINSNNVHYIKADTKMEFACICTPPWTEEHEFVVTECEKNNNISKCVEDGVLQILSEKEGHQVILYTIQNEFIPNENMKEFKRVYYFIGGSGNIEIDGKNFEINSNNCYEINNISNEVIKPNGNLKFVMVCDIMK